MISQSLSTPITNNHRVSRLLDKTLLMVMVLSSAGCGARKDIAAHDSKAGQAKNQFTEQIEPKQLTSSPSRSPQVKKHTWNTEAEEHAVKEYNFGNLIDEMNHSLVHEYVYRNTFNHTVDIINIENVKPCCGSVEPHGAINRTLEPNEEISFKVTLKPRSNHETIEHATTLETNKRSYTYVTTAHLYPALFVRQLKPAKALPLVGQKLEFAFELVTYDAALASMIERGMVTFRSQMQCEWGEVIKSSKLQQGLKEWNRLFVLRTPELKEIGAHSADVTIQVGQKNKTTATMVWETLPTIKAYPAGLFISSDQLTKNVHKHIMLKSTNAETFVIRKIETTHPAVRTKFSTLIKSTEQKFELEITPAFKTFHGPLDIIVETDQGHKQQLKVTIFKS